MAMAYRGGMTALGCAYWTMVSLLIAMLWITAQIYGVWHVETRGMWTTARVVSIRHCTDRNGIAPTIYLTVTFVDSGGVRRTSTTDCQSNRYKAGDSLAVSYVPGNPGAIVTREDIGGGQGFPLAMVIALDVALAGGVAAGGVVALRRRRNQASARAAAHAMGVPLRRTRPHGGGHGEQD